MPTPVRITNDAVRLPVSLGLYVPALTQISSPDTLAASAAVSAALTLEQIGPPTFDAATLAAASARRDDLLPHLTEVDGHDDE